jgi:protein-tyrosine phosphatase
MTELTRIWERLFLGGRLDAESLSRSNPFEISTVFSLCEEPVIRQNPAINYLHFPVRDRESLERGLFDAALDAIAENIRWGRILVHCGSGISRGPIFAAAWMHAAGYKNIDESLQEIAVLRPIIAPSEPLLASVREHLK